jgi:hypothetical protein
MEAIGSAQRTIDFETYVIHPEKVDSNSLALGMTRRF